MNTDEIIQLFRLADLAKLRKVVDKLTESSRAVIIIMLKKAQRKAPRVRANPKPEQYRDLDSSCGE